MNVPDAKDERLALGPKTVLNRDQNWMHSEAILSRSWQLAVEAAMCPSNFLSVVSSLRLKTACDCVSYSPQGIGKDRLGRGLVSVALCLALCSLLFRVLTAPERAIRCRRKPVQVRLS